ncbi:hypothetical protein [Pseudomonas subflava]|uniref:hypothetical protein n=1 Tax=Pseudomonas subflava TaxID=2952933 RepID=UPI002079F172|nr:hypothetical protein [Pseudomonas subflava]
MSTELETFFDDFVRAFARFDGALIARRYATPYLALDAAGQARAFATAEAIAGYFQSVLDHYAAQGCRSCRYHSLETVSLGSASVLASVTWELLDGEGRTLASWRESYNLKRGGEGLRIYASTDHAE